MKIKLLPTVNDELLELKNNPSKTRIFKDVLKALTLMEKNLRHPSLNTHEFEGLKGPNNEKIFEAYAQQRTSRAYRILWYYGPKRDEVSVIAIIPHPD